MQLAVLSSAYATIPPARAAAFLGLPSEADAVTRERTLKC